MPSRKFLTLDERPNVLKLFDKGKSCRSLAQEFQVGKTQIQGIVKRKREILEEYDGNHNMNYKRPRRTTPLEEVNELCLKWFTEATGRQINVSGPLLKEKALSFAKDLGLEDFKASNGWLNSFLKRNNIVFKTMSGERGSVKMDVVSEWKDKLSDVCEGFEPCDVWNMDETGLFYRDTTKTTFFKKGEDCAGGKRSKDRITVALCASQTGEKVKPLVIGKSKIPRCFSKINADTLPVRYTANRKAWMTGELFKDWLTWFDRQMRGRKVLLLVDNAPSHIVPRLTNVTVKFFPANTTSMCQPMDQGIIQAAKLKYRKRQLQHVLTQMEVQSGKSGPELLKEISVLDAIYWVAKSWKEVEAHTIQRCFARCGFMTARGEQEPVDTPPTAEDSDDEEDSYPIAVHRLASQLFGCEFRELLNIDKEFVTCDTDMTDWDKSANELLAEARMDEASDEEPVEESGSTESEDTPISLTECCELLDKLKSFACGTGNGQFMDCVMDMRDMLTELTVQKTTK